MSGSQRHDRLHVDLVERRQHRGGVLRLDQATRDARAQPRHRHAPFRALIRMRRRARRGAIVGTGRRWNASGLLRCGTQHVFLRHATVFAGAVDATRAPRPVPRRVLRAAGLTLADSRSTGAASAAAARGSLARCCGRHRCAADVAAAPSVNSRPLPRTTPCRRRPSRSAASVPSAGATTSSTTLSVSISTSTSSRLPASPGCLCQAATVPSAIDSGNARCLDFKRHAIVLPLFLVAARPIAHQPYSASSTRRACCWMCSCM